jgi:hypothetical protein
MSYGLPGGYNSADVFVTQRRNHEQDPAVSHSDHLNPLVAINEPRIDLFHAVCIFEGSDGVDKVHAVLAKVIGGFAVIPFRPCEKSA